MRFRIVFSVVLALLLVHCGDSPVEPVIEHNLPSFATTTTEDGLSISTDKDDYQPGDTVHFTGSGWQPFDVLDIVLTDDPETDPPHTWSVSVGPDGMFHDSTYVVDQGDLNVAFTLVATSRLTGRSLTVRFTDNIPAGSVSVTLNGVNSVTVSPGATISLAVTGRVSSQNSQNSPVTWQSTGWVLLTSPATTTPAGKLANCVDTPNVTGTSGNGTDATATFNITAPSTTGTYDLWLALSDQDGTGTSACGGGGQSTKARFVGVVTVQVVDQTRPTVTINQAAGQADPTNASPINFTVVFSENLSDFATGDVSLSGTAGATTATVTGSGTTYNVAVSGMTTAGTVIAAIGANVAHDGAGNGNDASTSTDNTVTYDNTGPTVTIDQKAGQADPTKTSPIEFTVVFSKSVADFATGDVTLSGTAGATTATVTGSGTTYNVAVSGMTSYGTVIATIAPGVATDAAGNGNAASSSTDNTVTFDQTRPTVTIEQAATQSDPTNSSPINFTVVFSEPVTNFVTGDVQLSGTANPTTATVTGSGTTYNVAVTGMANDGTVKADIGAGIATDAAGNLNFASTSTDNTVTYDNTPPTVTINQAASQADPTSASSINFTVVFSEAVSDFATGDVSLSGTAGATTAAVTGSGTTYNVAVSGMTTNGTVIASIASGVAHDAAGNPNTASTSTDHTVTYDAAPPTVTDVAVTPDPTNGSIDVAATAKVDDAASGNSKIVSAYYRIDNGSEVAMAAEDGSFNSATENVTASIPAATVAGLSNGSHQVCVRGVDEAGNSSSFSDTGACATLTVDKEPPVVSNVAVSPSLTNGSIAVTATATVSDATTGGSKIVAAYYKIDNGSPIQMSASDGSFSEATEDVTATISASVVNALSEGTHTVCVEGKDAAGNLSLFSATGACANLEIDKTPPEVTINQAAVQQDPTNGSTINFTVVFTENVSDFATGDVSLSGTAGATTATVTGNGKNYNVAVTGMTGDGTVIAEIASGKAHDAAGNGNNASSSTDNSVLYDNTPPAVSCGAADGAWHAADVSIGCTATDVTSGLKYPAADASFSLTTTVGAGTETSNASTNSRTIFDNAGNSSLAGPIGNNKIDKKAPQITAFTCPANPVILNDPAAVANWSATDGGSGVSPSGASSANGTVALVTNSIGQHTASVSKQDMVGNTSQTSNCTYTVAYNFAGFSAPVDRPNTMNVSKAGQAIPLKWRLTDALGRPITDLTSVSVQSVGMPCDTYTGTDAIEEYASGASGLQNLGDGYYQFNWKTPNNYAGTCKSIALTFGSGGGYTEKPSAYFTFKK